MLTDVLEHGTTRERGSWERIWVERAREKRTGEFIEPEWGRGDDYVISLFLLMKLNQLKCLQQSTKSAYPLFKAFLSLFYRTC